MARAVWAALALVVSLAPAAIAADECPRLKGFVLNLTPIPEGYLVPIGVAGTPRRLLLEFESAYTKLDEVVAAELKLPLKPVPRGLQIKSGNTIFTKVATAPEIILGRVPRKDVEFATGPHLPTWGAGEGVAAVDIFYGLDIELDLAHNRLGLYVPRDCDFQPLWPAEVFGTAPLKIQPTGGITLPMTLDDHAIEVAIVTSEERTYMPFDVAHYLFGVAEDDPALVLAGTKSDGEPVYRYAKFKKLVGGEKVSVDNPEIYIYRNKTPVCGGVAGRAFRAGTNTYCFGGGDIELGTRLLNKLHFYFAVKQKRVFFTLAEPPAQAGPAPLPNN